MLNIVFTYLLTYLLYLFIPIIMDDRPEVGEIKATHLHVLPTRGRMKLHYFITSKDSFYILTDLLLIRWMICFEIVLPGIAETYGHFVEYKSDVQR